MVWNASFEQNDLMICNAEDANVYCTVFLAENSSGVSETTTNIFLESAYFNSVSGAQNFQKTRFKDRCLVQV